MKIVGFIVAVIVLIVGALYFSYGEVAPCKVLAVERTRHAGLIDRATAPSTDSMSATECVSGLLDSWSLTG